MFKRYCTAIENTLLRIPFTSVFFAFLIPLYFMYSNGISLSVSDKFFENIFCDTYLLQLYAPIGLLVLLSGLGISREDDALRYIRLRSRKELAVTNIFSAIISSFAYIFMLLIIFSLYFKLAKGMSLANVWSAVIRVADYGSVLDVYPVPNVRNLFSPIEAVLIKCLFTSVYCTFLAILSMTVNAILKQSVGSIVCALTILCTSLFGKINYSNYSLYPWFNGDFKKLTAINGFTHVFYAVLYWIVALTIVIIIYCLVMRKCDLIGLSREDRT